MDRDPAATAAQESPAAARSVATFHARTASRDERRAGVRCARSAPVASLEDAAAAAGMSQRALSGALRGFRRRGRCDSIAAVAAESTNHQIRAAVASLRVCPPAVARLTEPGLAHPAPAAAAGMAGWSIRGVEDTAASRAVLIAASLTGRRSTMAAVLRNPSCPAAVVAASVSDPDAMIRNAAATAVSCPQTALGRLAFDSNTNVVLAVVKNPAAGDAVLAAAAADKQLALAVIDAFAERHDLGAAALGVLARHYYHEARIVSAAHERSAASLLSMLAYDDDKEVREIVAGNVNCHPTTLDRLAEDPAARAAVAGNPNTRSDTLLVLASDTDEAVIANVSTHHRCDKSVVAVLAARYRSDARIRAAYHRCCDPQTLAVLAQDDDQEVRSAVAANSVCGQALLAELAEDEECSVRSAVCQNPNISADLLEKLAADENRLVRAYATAAAESV